ncbi:Rcs stress response system protein RcsF [Pseudaeromonas paramecii]|uniref:Rcs stress response system protein RcsF n=1 Tax=Pseudaeromonas paramecii TaxID=2138166 RepID=A0ABP8Q680_9GAMM
MRRLPLALPLSLCLTLLTGCSYFSVHTNIDKENFTEYFKPGSVALVEKAQLEDLNYQVLGTVEAESCQADADQPVPNLGDARTEARRKVADMGGNGLLMGKCVTLAQTADCLSSLLCYGQALKVAEPAQ